MFSRYCVGELTFRHDEARVRADVLNSAQAWIPLRCEKRLEIIRKCDSVLTELYRGPMTTK